MFNPSRMACRKAIAAMLLAASAVTHAFPDKPITMIIPFAAGSSTDVVARDIGNLLAAALKQPVVFDNRTGAEGTIAANAVLNAPADGHTLLFTSSSLPVLDPLMKKNLPYDFVRDFAPVCSVSRVPFLVNVTGSSSLQTGADLISAAKAAPGKLTFAYSSASTRLAGELFQQAAGIKLSGVPYRSSVAGLTDVSGGQVDLFFIDDVSAGPFLQSGRLRPLLVAGPQRLRQLPNVPAATEMGLSGYTVQPWSGIYMSAKVPATVQRVVREAVARVVTSPAANAIYEKRNLIPMPLCGEELQKFQADDTAQWRQVITRSGIEPQ